MGRDEVLTCVHNASSILLRVFSHAQTREKILRLRFEPQKYSCRNRGAQETRRGHNANMNGIVNVVRNTIKTVRDTTREMRMINTQYNAMSYDECVMNVRLMKLPYSPPPPSL